MGETADQLRQEVDQTRENAAEKIDQIQAKVEDVAHQARESVDEAKQQVKEAFDLRKQIEERPLVALGAALAGGFLLGGLLGGEDNGRRSSSNRDWQPGQPGQQGQQGYGGYQGYRYGGPSAGQPSGGRIMENVRKAAKSSGLEETISGMVDSLMSSLTEQVKAIGEQAMPALKGANSRQTDNGAERDDARRGDTTRPPAERSLSARETGSVYDSASVATSDASPAGASF